MQVSTALILTRDPSLKIRVIITVLVALLAGCDDKR